MPDCPNRYACPHVLAERNAAINAIEVGAAYIREMCEGCGSDPPIGIDALPITENTTLYHVGNVGTEPEGYEVCGVIQASFHGIGGSPSHSTLSKRKPNTENGSI